ncbi:hypothetical protein E1166_03435 [Micromonospora sp. KC213]|nr:hypothetical protein E1166_03435 [Micromonospora sp. KC213]
MEAKIELMGLMAVRCAGIVYHLHGAQARVAFARLALAGPEGVTRHELADVIWPGALPPTWASALRTLISRLRAFVGPLQSHPVNPLVKRGGRYVLALDGNVLIDVEEAMRAVTDARGALDAGDFATADRLAAAAADRLRFPFLSEHEGHWVAERRERLTEYLVTALEVAGQAAMRSGDHPRAALLAEEATTRGPERESAHRCLMAVREAMGNRGEALRAYQRLRRHLAEEFGVDPSPETEAAYLALLGPASAPAVPSGGAGGYRHRPVPFVGREQQMTTVAGAWSWATRGRRQFVLVTGEAGIGKTRLLREAGAAVAADGGLVLVGRCDEDAMVPYQPIVEALDGYVAASPDDPLDAVSPAARGPLRMLLPSLGGPCPSGELPEQPVVFAAFAQLLTVAAGERPCALLIDDVHWADPQTVALLRYLLRAGADTRLCVVVAARNDLPTSIRRRVRGCMDEVMLPLEHTGEGTEVTLGGLDFAAARMLAAELGTAAGTADGDPVRWAHARSGGNPYMLLEVLRHQAGPDAVPPAVARLVAAKLASIGQDATQLLQVAAVMGPSFGFDTVADAANLDVLAALDALEALLEIGILAEVTAAGSQHPDRTAVYEFRHDIVRQSVDQQVSDARRRHLTSRRQVVPGAGHDTEHRLSRTGAERV